MSNNQQIKMNRIKVILVERGKTNRWLAGNWEKQIILYQGGILTNHNHQ